MSLVYWIFLHQNNHVELTDLFTCMEFPLIRLTMLKILLMILLILGGITIIVLSVSVLISILITRMILIILIGPSRVVLTILIVIVICLGTFSIIITLYIQVITVYHSLDKDIIESLFIRYRSKSRSLYNHDGSDVFVPNSKNVFTIINITTLVFNIYETFVKMQMTGYYQTLILII